MVKECCQKSINYLSVVKFVSTAMNQRNMLSVVFYRRICFFIIYNCQLKIDLSVGHEMNVHFHRQLPVWDDRHPPDPASRDTLTGRNPLCTTAIHHNSCSFCLCPQSWLSKVSAHLERALVQIKPWPCLLSGSQKILLENAMAAVLHLLSRSPATFAAHGDSPP